MNYHYLNPNLSMEEIREIDKMKADGRTELLATLDKCTEGVRKSCGELEAMRYKAQMISVLIQSL